MDWMQFVSALVSALAWPCAVVLVVCLLKNPILGLIPKIRSFKYGELQIDLGKELEAVKAEISEQAAESESPVLAPPPPPPPTTMELAAVSPRSAVLMSWREVEKEIDQTIAACHITLAYRHETNPGLKMRVLREKNLIDDNTMSTFKRMFGLRNTATHMTDVEISYNDAISMAELCEWLIQRLREAQFSAAPGNDTTKGL